jgi:hypothetical protein
LATVEGGNMAKSPREKPATVQKVLFVCFAVIFYCGTLTATTVVIVRDGNTITVGADSLGTYTVDGKRVPIPPICKVAQSHRFVFTATGRVLTTDGFDAYRIARSVISSPGDFDVIWASLRKKMDREVRAMNARDQVDGTGVKKGEGIIDIELVAVASPPKAVAWSWTFAESGKVEGSEVSIKDRAIKPFGTFEAATKWLQKYPSPKNTLGYVNAVLNVEAEGEPDKVGRPFSILTVTSSGISWVDRGSCK